MTRLTCWGHACVRIERGDARLVIDPGTFSDSGGALEGANAVLVTHEHVDHVDAEPLAGALERDPGLEVWAPAPVRELLTAAGVPGERVHVVSPGDRFTAVGFAVATVGDTHAEVHPDLPRVPNIGYLVQGVYHPGDALAVPEAPVQLLLAPVSAPWLRLAEAIDLVRTVRPATVVPIHDALLSERGLALADRLVGGLGGADYRRLGVGEGIDLD